MFRRYFSSRSRVESLKCVLSFLMRVNLTLNLKFVGTMKQIIASRVYYQAENLLVNLLLL